MERALRSSVAVARYVAPARPPLPFIFSHEASRSSRAIAFIAANIEAPTGITLSFSFHIALPAPLILHSHPSFHMQHLLLSFENSAVAASLDLDDLVRISSRESK
jgi:hypothetical protein